MISDETIHALFGGWESSLAAYWDQNLFSQLPSQFGRGLQSALGSRFYPENCVRNKLLFDSYRIIPKYCFACYKVQIKLDRVLDLFKLMIVFERSFLPKDNNRKCMVEGRPGIKDAYKGFVYSRSLKEAEQILNKVRKIVADEISSKAMVSLKRGCSEFSLVFPEFSRIRKGGRPVMRYKDEWITIEELAERSFPVARFQPDLQRLNQNISEFTLYDAQVMLTWLKYAATIGDESYRKITDKPVPRLVDLNRQ